MFGHVATVTDPAGKLWGYSVSINTVYDGTEQRKGGKWREKKRRSKILRDKKRMPDMVFINHFLYF